MRLKVLFITRNYLPKIGGLEVYGYNLIKEFEAHQITYKIALGKSKAHLIWFFPYCLVKALCIVRMHPIQLIHLCDGLLAPIGILLKLLAGARVSITIHGLDITYGNLFYQLIIPWCVAGLDRVICLSHSTRDECVGRRIPKDKCAVIPNGVRPNEIYLPQPREDHRHGLGELLGVSLDDKIVLLTIGRLVERKGVAWFVENVMPHLHPSYHYLIAGDGPQYRHIREVSVKRDLQERVLLLGTVSDEEKKRLFNASDILLMPNITVPHDVEGFGIVAMKAGSCGLPVIASNLQGIKDAVIDRKTGVLVEERDAEGYLREIKNMSLNRSEDLNGDFIVQFQHGLIDCRSKIKITLGLFTDDFYPHIGGIGRFVTEIASRLPENNLLIFSPCENKVSNHIQVEVAFHDIFKNLSFSFWLKT